MHESCGVGLLAYWKIWSEDFTYTCKFENGVRIKKRVTHAGFFEVRDESNSRVLEASESNWLLPDNLIRSAR